MPAHIGVVHTTAFTTKMSENFVAGLQSTGQWPDSTFDIQSKNNEGGYGHDPDGHTLKRLEKAVQDYATQRVQLIVAGGLAAVKAAYDVLKVVGAPQIPVIGLIGRVPKAGETGSDAIGDQTIVRCIVNLNTASHNVERQDKLHDTFNVAKNKVALMVNTNSAMGVDEFDDWVGAGQIGLKYPDLAGKPDNDHAHFGAFFKAARLQTNPEAIIVSSDPFFFRFRTRLIQAAAAQCPNVKFCFPFDEYKFKDDGTTVLPDWDDTKHLAFAGTGTNLSAAYRQLGICALEALASLFPPRVTIRTAGDC
jgi:hypothetical protein